jgi:hypothetical protein
MKKILAILLAMSISFSASAGFYESDYFEPIILGTTFAAAGYVASSENQALIAGIGAGVGFILGFGLNSYYRKKIDAVNLAEIAEKQALVDRKMAKQAQRANSGDMSQSYSIHTQLLEDGQMTPNNEYISPTYKTILKEP